MESLLFCPACGSVREVQASKLGGDLFECGTCGRADSLGALNEKIKGTKEVLEIERSALLHRLYGRQSAAAAKEAVIDEECPKCGHPQLSFHTAQLRGLDEGQTIFYTCLNQACKHKYNVNS